MTLDDGCCTLDPGHDGPCVWFCSTCSGTGRCPDCYGDGPEMAGCPSCDTTGRCWACGGAGDFVEDLPAPRPVITVELPGVSR